MRFTCPNCKQLTSEFEPPQKHLDLYFTKEELAVNEVVQKQPCSTCLTRTDV